ncbi:MAG: 16S rRNA (cytosine(967)-C(5))-methyltransferase RsmB [Anaerovoracaceae bacterium]|jgi:16S rRNA (cytosine967-C5)-methyltransferase
MDRNRIAAYAALMDVEKKHAYSNLALNHQIALHRPSAPAFVRRLVYGVLENRMCLDYYIDALTTRGLDRIGRPELTILRMGIYQLAEMEKVPEYAAVNESVNLARRYASGAADFINAVLHAYIRRHLEIRLPDRTKDEVRYLSIKYSYAPWIIRLWMRHYETPFVEELLRSGNETPATDLRLNWLKIVKEDLIDRLHAKGYEVLEGRFSSNALHVRGGDLLSNNLYKNGFYSIQDEASQYAVQLLAPAKGDTVMDVCAAPGGKTMAIAERMNNMGTIIASDIYRRKVDLIDREARRLGITNVKTRTWDATRVDSSLVSTADKVLVDAPCSGLGVVRRKPEIKYRELTEQMKTLPHTQLSILSAASKYVKPGGVLMYCTCTINPDENEYVVSDFLRRESGFRMDLSRQLLPNVDGTDGFYICRMVRENSFL